MLNFYLRYFSSQISQKTKHLNNKSSERAWNFCEKNVLQYQTDFFDFECLRWFIYLYVSYISVIPVVIVYYFSGYTRIPTGTDDHINGVSK